MKRIIQFLIRKSASAASRVIKLPVAERIAKLSLILWKEISWGLKPKDGVHLLTMMYKFLQEQISFQATRYNKGVHPKHRLMDYHRFFYSRLKPEERVIDIGSGIGALAYDMAKHGKARVVGMELSPKNLKQAEKEFSHPLVTYILGDALKSLPNETFDTAVMSNVLEHFKDRVGFLKKAQAQLRPKRWLLRIPRYDREWLVPLMDELGIDSRLDNTHFIEYTPETLEAELSQAGLKIKYVESRWGEFWCEAIPK
ncbi:class I SAM-dependent methyltransferase [Candidatus Parcubacteria bacterium]|nr:MAG: class I SAM-dependent methyltransferase [Candidatus Parcubacteria bacterium]